MEALTSEFGSLEGVASALLEAQSLVICGHISPDGDCIGSQLGLAHALRSLGKQVTCLLAHDEPIDYGLRFLPGASELVPASQFQGSFDTFVTVDVPAAARLGEEAAALHAGAAHTVTVDHHLFKTPLSQAYFVDSQAPSCSMIIWQLVELLGAPRMPEVALCCYTGLVTDTGGFSFQNTNAQALRLAAGMVEAGARPDLVAREVFQNRSLASLELQKVMLSRMSISEDGVSAISYLTCADFQELGAVKADAEPLINVLRSVRGIRVACILREQEDCVRGSLRAKDDTDVASIANRLGGGGHRAAAGFTFHGTLAQAREAVAAELAAL